MAVQQIVRPLNLSIEFTVLARVYSRPVRGRAINYEIMVYSYLIRHETIILRLVSFKIQIRDPYELF